MTTDSKVLASESSHWYFATGAPCYEVEGSNGQMRPTTLRDARKLGLVPSVTNILSVAARPGLEAWKARQILEAALTLPKLPDESLDDYATRVIEDSKAQGKKATERGTELHAAIERYIQSQGALQDSQWGDHILALLNALNQYGIDIFKGKPEHSFASSLGYGGKIDWHNYEIVLDFKTKANLSSKQLAWPENCYQLAAYAMGLWKIELDYGDKRRIINVFVGIEDCEVRIHEWDSDDVMDGWDAFSCLLEFWQITKKYKP